MGINYSPKIVTDGLVLALDAANPKSYPGSGSSILDLSKIKNNGTVVANSTFSTDFGGSLVYGASQGSGVVTLQPTTSGLNLGNETYSFWSKCMFTRTSSLGGAFTNWIVHFGSYFGNNSGGFGLQSGVFQYFVKGSTASGWSSNGGSSLANSIYDMYNWVYYVLQIEGNSNLKFFMNDNLIFNININDGYTGYTNNSLIIGKDMNMTFGEFKSYNRVLSLQEIKQNFNALRGRYGI